MLYMSDFVRNFINKVIIIIVIIATIIETIIETIVTIVAIVGYHGITENFRIFNVHVRPSIKGKT